MFKILRIGGFLLVTADNISYDLICLSKFLRAREGLRSKDKRRQKWAKKYFKTHPKAYKYVPPEQFAKIIN